MDVSKMIADMQRKAQNQRMTDIVNGINTLNEKSICEDTHMQEIREFIKYKYPALPSSDAQGDDIYGCILSKVDS